MSHFWRFYEAAPTRIKQDQSVVNAYFYRASLFTATIKPWVDYHIDLPLALIIIFTTFSYLYSLIFTKSEFCSRKMLYRCYFKEGREHHGGVDNQVKERLKRESCFYFRHFTFIKPNNIAFLNLLSSYFFDKKNV